MGDSSPQKPEAYIVHKGLDGIYVKESKICFIDGKNSKLFYRGYNIDELAETSTYEETAYLLLHGKLPTKNDLNEFDNTIKQNRKLPEQLIKFIQLYPRDGNTIIFISWSNLLTKYTKKDSGNLMADILFPLHTFLD